MHGRIDKGSHGTARLKVRIPNAEEYAHRPCEDHQITRSLTGKASHLSPYTSLISQPEMVLYSLT